MQRLVWRLQIALWVMLGTLTQAQATVGGDQYLEFLGYEPAEQKVYLLRHYLDGRARAPQLYYYHLASATPSRLVQVVSIYRLPNGKIDIDQDPVNSDFGRKLTAIKQRLVALQPIPTASIGLRRLQHTKRSVVAWFDDYEGKPDTQKQRINAYHDNYWLYAVRSREDYRHACLRSQAQMAISYRPQLNVQQAFAIPSQGAIVASVKYLADQFEVGYYHEDPVLLSPIRLWAGSHLQNLVYCHW